MVFGLALFAVVVSRGEFTLLGESDARTVLPDHAYLTLYHEFWGIAIIID